MPTVEVTITVRVDPNGTLDQLGVSVDAEELVDVCKYYHDDRLYDVLAAAEKLIKRYSISYVDSRAVLLLDIVELVRQRCRMVTQLEAPFLSVPSRRSRRPPR